MVSKKIMNYLWPKITDASTAESATKQGLFRAVFAIIYVLSSWICFSSADKNNIICQILYYLPSGLIGVSLSWLLGFFTIIPLLLVCFGIYHRSRIAAISLLLIDLSSLLGFKFEISDLIRNLTLNRSIFIYLSHILLQSSFLLMSINATRGAFAYNRYNNSEAVCGEKSRTLPNITLFISIAIIFIMLVFFAFDFTFNQTRRSEVQIEFPTISPDNNKILFSYLGYGAGMKFKIATYDLSSSELYSYDNIKFGSSDPSYSRDGKQIVFVGYNGKNSNIYIMKTDGSDIRQVTNRKAKTNGNKEIISESYTDPSFSPDGKLIIFTRSGGTGYVQGSGIYDEKSGKHLHDTGPAYWDVFTVDVDTGIERRLTNYRFSKISKPYFLADGKKFVFSGEGPFDNDNVLGPKDYKEYEKIFGKNFICIMDGKNNILKPAFTNGQHSHKPSVSYNDKIQFISKLSEKDCVNKKAGHPCYDRDLYVFENHKVHRLTKINSEIADSVISPDGNYSLYRIFTGRKSKRYELWIMKNDGTNIKEIDIPEDKLK